MPELDIFWFLLLLPLFLAVAVGSLMLLHHVLQKREQPTIHGYPKDFTYTAIKPEEAKKYGPPMEGDGDGY